MIEEPKEIVDSGNNATAGDRARGMEIGRPRSFSTVRRSCSPFPHRGPPPPPPRLHVMQESPGEGNSEEEDKMDMLDKERAVKVGGRENEREDGGSGESSGEEGSSGGSSGYCSTSPGAICATFFSSKNHTLNIFLFHHQTRQIWTHTIPFLPLPHATLAVQRLIHPFPLLCQDHGLCAPIVQWVSLIRI